jgi:hypothetical protein
MGVLGTYEKPHLEESISNSKLFVLTSPCAAKPLQGVL